MTNLTYKQNGDYLLPDLTLNPTPQAEPIGKYGKMRDSFLKKNRSGLRTRLVLTGKLPEHLREVDQRTQEMMDSAVKRMAMEQGVNEELKARDQAQWTDMMNNFVQAAKEMILPETVYNNGKVS